MKAFLAVLGLLLLAGCGAAGAHTRITAAHASYPISLSRNVRGPEGDVLPPNRLRTVGEFHEERLAWALFYSFLPLTPTMDISDAINRQVSRLDGDAVVWMRVATGPCLSFIGTALFGLLPIYPGCARVIFSGRVVKMVGTSGEQAASSPAGNPSTPGGASR